MPHSFFGLMIDPYSQIGKLLVLLLAALLGGAIGLERQWNGHPAGLRTHILVCVGSTLITLTSVEIGANPGGPHIGDPARLSAQIVSGIGFLGAGAILRDGSSVYGLTTAASVWTTAGIGIALGANPHLGELAVMATVIVLITLILLARLETALRLTSFYRTLIVRIHEGDDGPARVLALLSARKIVIQSLSQTVEASAPEVSGTGAALRKMQMSLRLPGNFDPNPLNTLLASEKGVVSFQWDGRSV